MAKGVQLSETAASLIVAGGQLSPSGRMIVFSDIDGKKRKVFLRNGEIISCKGFSSIMVDKRNKPILYRRFDR